MPTLTHDPADGVADPLAALNSRLDELQRAPKAAPKKVDCAIDWREVIDTSNDAFIATDASGVVLEWNVKAEQLFGWSAEEAVGRHLVDTIFPPCNEAPDTGGLKLLLSANSAGKRHEMTARRKDGSQTPVEASVSMMRCGSSFVFNAFIHDITQRRQLQVQLTHAQKLESIGQLSAGIAHEINTPTQYVGDNTRFLQESLSEIFGALKAYEKLAECVRSSEGIEDALADVDKIIADADLEYLVPEISEAVTQTLEGVRRVASIVRAMKEFSHPGSTAKTPTDLNSAIQNTVTVATNEWKYVALIETDFDASLPRVPVLPGDFNQVILNLIVNASQAIEERNGSDGEKGVIRVSTLRDGEQAIVRVEDSGKGIPEEVLNRIFDPFFTTKDVGVGTGQGLAISRSVIVDKHQGTLEASNREEGGACFTIRLPLGQDPEGGSP